MSNVIFSAKEMDGLPYVTILPPDHRAYRIRWMLRELGVWFGVCADHQTQA